MFENKEAKKRRQTRERVRKHREKQASVTTVTESVTASKMICKCTYYKMVNGELVCIQCGKPPNKSNISDKIRKGVEFK